MHKKTNVVYLDFFLHEFFTTWKMVYKLWTILISKRLEIESYRMQGWKDNFKQFKNRIYVLMFYAEKTAIFMYTGGAVYIRKIVIHLSLNAWVGKKTI